MSGAIVFRFGLLAAFLGLGCGGTMLLKSPVAERCRDAGLRGCDDLVDGVVGYVDGADKDAARQKLQKGAAQNQPEQVGEFAAKLRLITKLPGLEGMSGPLGEVAAILDPSASDAPPGAKPAGSGVRPALPASSGAPSGGNDDARTKTTTAIVPGHARAYACAPLSKTSPAYAGSTCVRIGIGPMVVTDLVVGGACASDVVVLAGSTDAPSWVVASAPRERMDMHGARLVVAPEDEVVVALHAPNATLPRDASCGVTLSTRRP
jgi:hypothetical protein